MGVHKPAPARRIRGNALDPLQRRYRTKKSVAKAPETTTLVELVAALAAESPMGDSVLPADALDKPTWFLPRLPIMSTTETRY